jgi:hypothetical protein
MRQLHLAVVCRYPNMSGGTGGTAYYLSFVKDPCAGDFKCELNAIVNGK